MRTFAQFIILLLASTGSSVARADSSAGVEVHAGQFGIMLTYSAAEDDGVVFEYLKQPSGALFDVVSALQANYKPLASRDEQYWIEVSFEVPVVFVRKKDAATGEYKPLRTIDYKGSFTPIVREQLCSVIGRAECVSAIDDRKTETVLYVSSRNLDQRTPDVVLFGAFPSDNTIAGHVLRPSDSRNAKYQKVRVTRDSIGRYFCALE